MKDAIAAIVLSIYFTSALGGNIDIEWELTNPLKFVTDGELYTVAKSIYSTLDLEQKSKTPLTAIERELHKANFYGGPPYLRNGWATSISKNDYKNTCWDRKSAKYINTGKCYDYIHPIAHEVKMWVSGIRSENADCTWQYKDSTNAIKCSEELYIEKIPYPEGLTVKLTVQYGNKTVTINKHIVVEDVLVVGLGDSFASGEGNPDLPVSFHDDTPPDRDITAPIKHYTPRKDKNMHAKWLDRRCHRSLYSYQFKTVIGMALENPKRAVTFLFYSCTGAQIPHILDTWKSAAEYIKYMGRDNQGKFNILNDSQFTKDRRMWVRPQIDVLIEDITCPVDWKGQCEKGTRTIDYMLLSIGGNDIGFAKYVINIARSEKSYFMKKLAEKPSEKTARDIEKLKQEYVELNKAFIDKLSIRDCSEAGTCERILLTTYPNIMYDENGKLCTSDKGAFYIPFGKDENRGVRIKETYEKVLVPLQIAQNTLKEKDVQWSIINSHSDSYSLHGFCAQNKSNTLSANEKFVIPYKHKNTDKIWNSFDPRAYRPYGNMQRWIRLPVDSKLSINMTELERDWGYSDETSGIVHPNSMGHSATADANLMVIRELQ
ncbi:MAG: hypothetical protein AB2704_26035 [Candidatus Thiodiazotropha taylori]